MKYNVLNIDLIEFQRLQKSNKVYPHFEFHVLASLRRKYKIDEALFSSSGNIIFPNYHAVRNLAQKINENRDLHNHPERRVIPGQLNAMGLLDEIYHYVLRLYEETTNPKVFGRALLTSREKLNPKKLNDTILSFGTLFPPLDVYLGKTTLKDYINFSLGDKPNLEVILEELILLYFCNFNPANSNFKELFDDKDLRENTAYAALIKELDEFFQKEKRFGPHNQYIFDLLRAPILASPNNLKGQLEYIKNHWGMLLSEKYLKRILSADDLIKEDMRIVSLGEPQVPPVPTYRYHELIDTGLLDLERFTSDLDWMPNVVLLAKNTHVWLNQLSKKYKRQISKLNEIPDEELEQLARWNFTALWLIGIWERSSASQKIKQWSGNPEAVSSAYSIYDYEIASDLGGEEAFQNLRNRAWQRGIRLAGDMVPNHMGIYSKWIIEHPEYFIQSNYPPFPNYRFTGGNLSEHPDIEIRIEDGYWNRTDAAVVFQRIDKRNGDIRYIYHGNDGTHMPWNDTAQLDFLKAEVREKVIQTIFHVARKFPIIRFDAAMTLTKRHFQRLWYPQPGSGGDIPSRVDFGMSTSDFNKLFPNEFWREVVDRINQEMPNTLLLAEAFWLLEGYFVRTLGMHRVYNSAFMHMLMKEENHKYRELIKNTLHYNPEILKRYVNFLSNPDEQTAIAQFGKDDKYFGAALMMVTLPGLPMFAHGQIEGYTEKYGMEYKRDYYNEVPDQHLIHRHEQEIFPLLRKRYLFSQVSNFELYNFIDNNGNLNENVFAYSNKSGNERAIICFHNKYDEASGWIKNSVGRNIGATDNPKIIYRTLAEALELSDADDVFYIFRDYKTKLEYIRSGKDLHTRGLGIQLKAFQYHVFLDFLEIHDANQEYERLCKHLHGKGVPNIQEEFWMVKVFPIHLKLFDVINKEKLNTLHNFCFSDATKLQPGDKTIESVFNNYRQLAQQVKALLNTSWEVEDIVIEFKTKIQSVKELSLQNFINDNGAAIINFSDVYNQLIIFTWLTIQSLNPSDKIKTYDTLRINKALRDIFESLNLDNAKTQGIINLIQFLLSDYILFSDEPKIAEKFFDSKSVQEFIGLHEYNGIKYFNKERFEEMLNWTFIKFLIDNKDLKSEQINTAFKLYKNILKKSKASKYKFEIFKRTLIEGS